MTGRIFVLDHETNMKNHEVNQETDLQLARGTTPSGRGRVIHRKVVM